MNNKKMRLPNHFLLFLLFLLPLSAAAQTAKEEIRQNARLSASNYLAYAGPRQKLTPAPKGLKPFYLSHYGRHGSRYLINRREYVYPYETLTRADSAGKLTPLGADVLRRLRLIEAEAKKRHGELTPLGAQQQKEIARRMFERFPEVFEGEAAVDAKSTIVIRSILSMENALQELLRLNPRLNVSHDASEHDMFYMNQNDPKLWNSKMPPAAQKVYDDYCLRHERGVNVVSRLISDSAYIANEMNPARLNYYLFKLASNVQNTELRRQITLYDLFDDNDLYHNWLKENTWWYIAFGASPLTGSVQPFSQRNLLRQIIAEADSAIAQPRHGASLRFGHETIVLPLVCLLEINNFGIQVKDLDLLDRKGWHNYRVFPMSANIQFVFYRRDATDRDVWFKVLLNEDEVTLPLKSSRSPYYRWADFRDYFLKKLDSYVN